MAGDWIKLEVSTGDKPEIYGMAEILNIDPDAVLGKIFRVWIWFDSHTENGNAPSVTKKLLDRLTCVTGFTDAMESVGWLVREDDFISLPNFDRHNGKTAKNRALTNKRVAKRRQNVTEIFEECNGDSVTKSLPEKRREEKSIKEKKGKPKVFAKPDLNHISTFINENDYAVNPNTFFNHYESNGWLVGKNKMKDWKAAVRSWNSKNKENTSVINQPVVEAFPNE